MQKWKGEDGVRGKEDAMDRGDGRVEMVVYVLFL